MYNLCKHYSSGTDGHNYRRKYIIYLVTYSIWNLYDGEIVKEFSKSPKVVAWNFSGKLEVDEPSENVKKKNDKSMYWVYIVGSLRWICIWICSGRVMGNVWGKQVTRQ